MLPQPLAKCRCRSILGQSLGLLHHFGWNPFRECDLLHDVLSALRVDLSNRGQPLLGKSVSKSHKSGPKATVHKRHLAFHKPADVNKIGAPDVPRQSMNGVRLGMRPPVSSNAFSRNFFDQAWNRAVCRFKNNSMHLNKANCFVIRHLPSRLVRNPPAVCRGGTLIDTLRANLHLATV